MARKSLKSMFSRKKKVGMSDEDRFGHITRQQLLEESKRIKKQEKERKEREKQRKERERKMRNPKVGIAPRESEPIQIRPRRRPQQRSDTRTSSSVQQIPQQRDDSRMSSSVEDRPDVRMVKTVNMEKMARKLQQDRRNQALEAQERQAKEAQERQAKKVDPTSGIDLTFLD